MTCIPKITKDTSYIKKISVPWWDDECKEAVKKSKDALNFYRTNPTIDNYITYKRLDAKKKLIIKEKKHSSWRCLCEYFNRYTPVSLIWNYIRKFKRIKITNRPKNDEWIPSFLDKYAPLTSTEIEIENATLDTIFNNEGNNTGHFLTLPFTWQEFSLTLKSRKKDSTPGLDDIPYKLIINLHDDAKRILLNIFNQLWEKGVIPPTWKTQCVIPILKPDKPVNDSNSYRPISLSSCLGKLFEGMVKTRLDYYTESNKILPTQQFGFRKGRSCAESFVTLLADIRNSFYAHSSTVCAFLDVQGAFDNVNPSVLAVVLSEVGVPGKVCKWIFEFLYNRTMYVKFNNILHGPRQVYKGTMQGSTISPLLYNLYTCQICKYLTVNNVKFLQFADDIVVYTVHKDVNIAVNNLNLLLQED
ncbi:reverse transcriptase (RNA-dependent DNA polymerase) domain-containing protein [Phthorimaea operculella]|nr:reverse transcriptase (RNA-dependent DNA polymerase) domain-containing protein [Phthorimaea operculella]